LIEHRLPTTACEASFAGDLPVPTAGGPSSKIDCPAVTAIKIKVHSPSIRPAAFPQVVLAADKKAPVVADAIRLVSKKG
jgi:hypothetical protein